MKYLIYPILLLILFNKGFAQTILNGDFETNSASFCEFNIQNSVYSNRMNNSWGFGSGNELDIQNNSCGYANSPSNNWFVSLSKQTNGTYDELSLKLSSNLKTGNSYQISYLEFAAYGAGYSNIPLQIGLSSDSLNFGQQIYNSLPIVNAWTQRAFTFIAPNNGKYITVRIDSIGYLKGWDFIDNIQLTSIDGIKDISLNTTTHLFPNPTKGKFTASFPLGVQYIQISNSIGQLITTKDVNGLTSVSLDIENNGLYFINFSTKTNSITKKLVVYSQ